jgi:hypothetical protein
MASSPQLSKLARRYDGVINAAASNSLNSEHFYADLPVCEDFTDVSRPEKFAHLPIDWSVVVSDVAGSTDAVRRGQYKDVNLIGASTIISILNAARPLPIPYVFGGDGATLCVPPALVEPAKEALLATQAMAREEFNLRLRAGIVPATAIRGAGLAINVAKCRTSAHCVQAAFTGGGLQWAERLIKDEQLGRAYRLGEGDLATARDAKGDFSGLECRWDNIPSAHGEIVTLLVQAIAPVIERNAQTYREVLAAIERIYGAAEISRPAAASQMTLSTDSEVFRREAKIRFAGRSVWLQRLLTWGIQFQMFFGRLFIDKGWHVAGIDWRKYKDDVIANTDYRKFDDVLRHVLSGNAEQRKRLSQFLEERYQNSELVYGLHTASTAMMTCLIFQRDGGHVHFVDGADGGYAMAAEDLKQRLFCKLK